MTPTSRQSGSKDQILLRPGTVGEKSRGSFPLLAGRTAPEQNGPASVVGLLSDVVVAGSSDSVKRHLLFGLFCRL
jgi:hypothetical protein